MPRLVVGLDQAVPVVVLVDPDLAAPDIHLLRFVAGGIVGVIPGAVGRQLVAGRDRVAGLGAVAVLVPGVVVGAVGRYLPGVVVAVVLGGAEGARLGGDLPRIIVCVGERVNRCAA